MSKSIQLLTKLTKSIVSGITHFSLLACVVMTPFALAEQITVDAPIQAISAGGLKNELTPELKTTLLTQAKAQAEFPLVGKTREQMKSQKSVMKMNKSSSREKHLGYYHSFNLYDATSYLEEDIDYDGFYRTFSVVFDADVISDMSEVSEVYAELYLSVNGGPWRHYFTTDSFLIYGESSDDEYEVVTTLLEGYHTDHYDVLIDLYEIGYPDIVATLSSDEDNELYALPLESVEYDYYEEYYDSHSHGHGGSMGIFFIVLLATSLVCKRLSHRI